MAMNDGGHAFPLRVPTKYLNGIPVEADVHPGMTLRQYYAGLMLAEAASYGQGPRYAAKLALEYADALIAELRK